MSHLADQLAYPSNRKNEYSGNTIHFAGMTMRQHYAGLALPEAMKIISTHAAAKSPEEQRELVAYICVQMADALIAELEKS